MYDNVMCIYIMYCIFYIIFFINAIQNSVNFKKNGSLWILCFGLIIKNLYIMIKTFCLYIKSNRFLS